MAAEEGLGKRLTKKKKQDPGRIDASAAGIILSDFIENRKIIYPPGN
jgi:RNase H-fold protein (predicted Holliday junction resolvase)